MSPSPRSFASVVLRSPDAVVVVEPAFGGRLSSVQVGGHELLWQPEGPMPGASHPFGWGSFVMAPYAGRIRRGDLLVGDTTHHLPITMAPHAIHGTVYDVAWSVDAVGCSGRDGLDGRDELDAVGSSWVQLSADFGPPWPFAGRVHQRIELFDRRSIGSDPLDASDGSDAPHALGGRLRQELWVEASDTMPVTMGWHPWFTRRLPGVEAALEWSFDPTGVTMYRRDGDGIAVDELVEVPPGPWDDCFDGVGAVTVRWPGVMRVTVEHDCPVVVLFDGLDHAVCVEPQTGPPDGLAVWGERVMLGAGEVRSARMTWTWAAEPPA